MAAFTDKSDLPDRTTAERGCSVPVACLIEKPAAASTT
jgi:hypothetical protein